MTLRRTLKTLSRSTVTVLLLGLIGLLGANVLVLRIGGERIIKNIDQLPLGATGLVLGTAPKSPGGGSPNPFFEARMDAAARLYKAGAINRLLLSGDNRRADYNEPVAMRDALRQRGLPEAALCMDYAGFRTLDSIIRARKVFQLEKDVVVITDDFHLPRALFIAEGTGLAALGFSSEPVPWRRSYRTRLREWLSRARACLDVYLWKTQPRFLGTPVPLPAGIDP
jgi:SanA protein